MTGSTRTEADRDLAQWRSRAWPLLDISWRRFHPCPTLRTQPGASSTNSSRIFFCCLRRDGDSPDGFSEACLRCPKGGKQRAPDKRTRQGPTAPLAHRRPGYPLSGCVPAEPDSVSPGDFSIAMQFLFRQPINRPRSRLRTWLRTQILDMRWQLLLVISIRAQPRTKRDQTAALAENAILDIRRQLLRKNAYPPLTPNRPHSSHGKRETSSADRENPKDSFRAYFAGVYVCFGGSARWPQSWPVWCARNWRQMTRTSRQNATVCVLMRK